MLKRIIITCEEDNLLNVQERECDSLPEVISVLASYFEMFIVLLLDEWIVLDGNCVPHEILERNNCRFISGTIIISEGF